MTDDEPVTIRKFGTPQDAYLAKNLLEAENIPARVGDESVTSWLWHVGTALGGTKLLVANRDAARAAEVLRSIESHSGEADGEVWCCPHCGAEVDAGFDLCWSCEAARDESDSRASDRQGSQPSRGEPESETEEDARSPADADAFRAWRSAVIGLLFPPFQLYSLFLVLKTMRHELGPPATWRFYAAMSISLLTLTIWWTILFRL